MKTLPLSLVVVLAVLGIAPAFSATKPVEITSAGFKPKTVTIDFGDTVTWTNKDTANHLISADNAAFTGSPVLAANQAYSYTFMKAGSFGYRDGLNTTHRGTVTVRTGLTIGAAPAMVTYGGGATLSGVTSAGAAGDTITIKAMDCTKKVFSTLGTVMSAANGAWSSPVTPALNTTYQATWKNRKSAEVAEKVAPLLTLKRVRKGRFTASLTAAQAFTGKFVNLQRYAPKRKAWKRVKRVTLTVAKPGVPATTVVTSAGFKASVARRTRLRIVLPAGQAGTCYVPSKSAPVRA
jgi:plastocyanin